MVQREPHNLIIRLKLLPSDKTKGTKRKRKKGEGCPMGFDSSHTNNNQDLTKTS